MSLALPVALLTPVGATPTAGPNPPLPPPSYTASVQAFPVPGPGTLTTIVKGPDGNLWYIGLGAGIGRTTPGGAMTVFPVRGSPNDITVGPDGNLWFTASGCCPSGDYVGRMTPSGSLTEFVLPDPRAYPFGITAGPGGNLWFTEDGVSKIGEISTSGALVGEFAVPGGSDGPRYITAGSDGNLWYATGDAIGRMTPTGDATLFTVPAQPPDFYPGTEQLTLGPDGNVWFTERIDNRIGRVTPAGTITLFPVPTTASQPEGIAVGPDGNLWFTEYLGNRVGRITTSGVITEVHIPTMTTFPFGITTGPDGKIWFTEERNLSPVGAIVRLDPATLTAPPGPCLTVTRTTTLTHDVGPCPGDGILVTGSNLLLNLNGHKVLGARRQLGDFAGIHVLGSRVRVTGGVGKTTAEVTGFDAGVFIHENASNNEVQHLSIHDNVGAIDLASFLGDGVVVIHATNNNIHDNRIVHNGIYDGVGILGQGSNSNTVNANTVQDTTTAGTGTDLAPGAGTGVIVNPFYEPENPRRGESITGNNVEHNVVVDNENSGISNISNVNALILANDIERNGATSGDDPANGIGVQRLLRANPKTNDSVAGNTVKGNGGDGISVSSESNQIIANISTDNAQSFGNDLRDLTLYSTGVPCDSNRWFGNTWGSAGFFPDCVAAGGHGPNPPPGASSAAESPPPDHTRSVPSGRSGPSGRAQRTVEPFDRGKPSS